MIAHSNTFARRRRHQREPVNLGVLGSIIFLPLLAIAALISLPYSWIQRGIVERRERRFAREMKLAGRLKSWSEVEELVRGNAGTFIAEYLSMKGPTRLWWTEDRICETTPYKYVSSENREHICYEMEFRPFGNWCFRKYTSHVSGKAYLLGLPEDQKKTIWKRIVVLDCVSTYSRKAWKA